jgi:hypothetical protein
MDSWFSTWIDFGVFVWKLSHEWSWARKYVRQALKRFYFFSFIGTNKIAPCLKVVY